MRVHEMIERYYPQYYSIETYDSGNVARIHKIDGEWGVFSNFARTPLLVEGKEFDTSERLFQVMKMATKESQTSVYEAKGNPKMRAKHIAKVTPEQIRPDWPQIIVDVMKFCLMTKYGQSPDFRAALDRSKGMAIVEDQTSFPRKNADTWGVKLKDGKYVGPNLLGRLLMELRDNGRLNYSLPAGILLI
jgi:Uncharacterized protein conserved in bacteria